MTAPTATRLPDPPRVLSTLNEDGSRRWLRPRPSPGRFLNRRRAVAYALILVFTALPLIHVWGKPLVLLDLASRRFTIFGATFLPTDTLLLALFMVAVFVLIFLLTALFGRVWCGWACPQTVYMEFVFRPIERFFEGAPGRRNTNPLARSGVGTILKYVVYFVIALYLANTFLAYFVGVDKLALWVTRSPLDHPAGFTIVAAVTALMMFDFCWFREQTCILACPYGRFQSALLDRNSLIVSYDRSRGEPRGRHTRVSLPVADPAPRRGDCVDCGMCVTTCPTGIDIRDGLQMECLHCTQCIDACDAVMTKLHRPRGLIRYGSQAAMAGEKRRLLRPRVVLYPLIFTALLAAFTVILVTRDPVDITVLRGFGAPFVRLPGDEVGNQIRVKVVNRTDRAVACTVSAEPGRIQAEENPVTVGPGKSRTVPLMVVVPSGGFTHGSRPVEIRFSDGADFRTHVHYTLLGPGGSP